MSKSEEVHQNLDEKKNPSGFFDTYTETSLRYDPARCINCRRCSQVCPHAVFAEGPEHAELARPAACMECGACAKNCPARAIEVTAGVGCAAAIIAGKLRGTEPTCDCGCESRTETKKKNACC